MNFERIPSAVVFKVLDLVPLPVRLQLQLNNIVLAGGCIRDTMAGLPVKDLDIFCHSEEQAARLAQEASNYVTRTLFAYTAKTFTLPVQYVFYKDFADARDLVGQFDFRACCAGIYWGGFSLDTRLTDWEGIAVEGFGTDCLAKELSFMSQQKDEKKLTALGRALKLAEKGWKLSADEAAAIILHWQDVKPSAADYAIRRASTRASFSPHYGRL